jgi:hypothetical protein
MSCLLGNPLLPCHSREDRITCMPYSLMLCKDCLLVINAMDSSCTSLRGCGLSARPALLTDAVCCSAQAQKVVKEKLGVAERVLKLAELCRKLETEQEKILPFWNEQAAAAHLQVSSILSCKVP